MRRPDMTWKHLDTAVVKQSFELATLEDSRNAECIQRYSKNNGYRASDSIAAGIRFGFMQGRINGNRRAQEAHTRLHEFIGTQDKSAPPAERIRNAAGWIDVPDVLRELALFLECRAAALEAGTAKVKPLEPEPDPDAEREEPQSANDDV